MRNLVLQMMTTLNGRVDDPDAWIGDFGDDLYSVIDRAYSVFDTVLVGRATYQEMFEYWPGAETEEGGSEINKSMARKMNTYKKYVFSRSHKGPLEWNNAEPIAARTDAELSAFVADLKAQSGGDIHLSGGADLAQSMARLGLVDEYRFFVHPVLSAGAAWWAQIVDKRELELLSATTYNNGIVAQYYKPKSA